MPAARNIAGLKSGRLTAVSFSHKQGQKNMWSCLCECGNRVTVELSSVTCGKTLSCGCYASERKREVCIKRNTTHGVSNTAAYKIWHDMHRRCYDERRKSFKNYGGRGIQVENSWHVFENFLADMGQPPAGLSLDRIDNDGNYSAKNCRWSNGIEQANNRRNNTTHLIGGLLLTSVQVARKFGINYATLRSLLNRNNWTIERIIEKHGTKHT